MLGSAFGESTDTILADLVGILIELAKNNGDTTRWQQTAMIKPSFGPSV